ncbi:hypothetical protein PTKIN_Ptkin18bG0052500 [Pterospermum kingtungense]
MPGVRRSMFGCAFDDDRMVYVAGGHDDEKNALRSALAYDVAKDEWIPLPDMARERKECKGVVVHRGKLHAVGGYCTDMQGRRQKSAEVFNIATWRWEQVDDFFLKASTCPRTCTGGDDMDMYRVAYMTSWQNKLVVIGCSRSGEAHNAHVLNLKRAEWTELKMPEKYCGYVQSGCYLEI